MTQARFETTQWTMIAEATRTRAPGAEQALDALCRRYWKPLYAYARKRGHGMEEAQDLTQEFYATLLEKGYFKQADRTRGRFRTFLLSAFSHFLANEWDRARTQKRGGDWTLVPLDGTPREPELAAAATPEQLFEREWALTLLERVLGRLRIEFQAADRERDFLLLKSFLTGESERGAYAEVAQALDRTENAVKTTVHRLRRRYRQLLSEEVQETVDSPGDIKEEIAHLIQVLSR